MSFVYIPPQMLGVRMVSVPYHMTYSSASTKGWYLFCSLSNKGGVMILVEHEFNELGSTFRWCT